MKASQDALIMLRSKGRKGRRGVSRDTVFTAEVTKNGMSQSLFHNRLSAVAKIQAD